MFYWYFSTWTTALSNWLIRWRGKERKCIGSFVVIDRNQGIRVGVRCCFIRSSNKNWLNKQNPDQEEEANGTTLCIIRYILGWIYVALSIQSTSFRKPDPYHSTEISTSKVGSPHRYVLIFLLFILDWSRSSLSFSRFLARSLLF